MTRTWLSIRVDLVEGRGECLWPRPGRIFAAARSHTFAALATAIDDAYARWDHAHLHEFHLADSTRLTTPYGVDDEFGPSLDDRRTKLSRLRPDEQFLYTFDLGADWTHLCTVGPERIDPEEELGIVPGVPLAYWGWGTIPDQYGRRWDGDDGEGRRPRDPCGADLPPLRLPSGSSGLGPPPPGGPAVDRRRPPCGVGPATARRHG